MTTFGACGMMACSGGTETPPGTGGQPSGSGGSGSGGATSPGTGGAGTGGSGSGGATSNGSGGAVAPATGGAGTGGAVASGGAGGTASTGGRGTGGAAGGAATGGRGGTAGAASGGSGSGGAGVGGGSGGPGMVDLFNGTDLTGWTAYQQVDKAQGPGKVLSATEVQRVFKVEAGQIRVYGDETVATEQARATLVTAMSYSKYNFFLEYKWGTKTYPPYADVGTYPRDAGILFHLHGDRTVVWPSSIEFQIKQGFTGDIFALYARCTSLAQGGGTTFVEGGTAKVVNGANGNVQHARLAGSNPELPEWNSLQLQVNGGAAVYIVNGKIVNRVSAVNDRSGTTGMPVTSGPIALQAEHAEVFYRNIRIQVLP
ncbi:MAG: DUF1080 domain-containing protein [Pseudomonadota bacterium]